jgi:hypothetical protein
MTEIYFPRRREAPFQWLACSNFVLTVTLMLAIRSYVLRPINAPHPSCCFEPQSDIICMTMSEEQTQFCSNLLQQLASTILQDLQYKPYSWKTRISRDSNLLHEIELSQNRLEKIITHFNKWVQIVTNKTLLQERYQQCFMAFNLNFENED